MKVKVVAKAAARAERDQSEGCSLNRTVTSNSKTLLKHEP